MLEDSLAPNALLREANTLEDLHTPAVALVNPGLDPRELRKSGKCPSAEPLDGAGRDALAPLLLGQPVPKFPGVAFGILRVTATDTKTDQWFLPTGLRPGLIFPPGFNSTCSPQPHVTVMLTWSRVRYHRHMFRRSSKYKSRRAAHAWSIS